MDSIVLVDAHCHPTDHPNTLDLIKSMKASKLILMSTNFDDIDIVDLAASKYPDKVIPAFGYHPWFSHKLYIGDKPGSKGEHYKSVLNPVPSDEFIDTLPFPQPLDEHVAKIRDLLIKHPNALVGELGLDKSFRLPESIYSEESSTGTPRRTLSPYKVDLNHQVAVFESILQIAKELQRSVSVHGVNCHNTVFNSIMKVLGGKDCRSKICLHSYSGSGEFLASNWLKRLNGRVFISCSVLINITSKERVDRLLSRVPSDIILSESDYHEAGELMDSYILDSVNIINNYYGWDIKQGSDKIKENFDKFVEIDHVM